MGTDRRVEVKPLSGHASFSSPTSSSSSSPRNRNLEHSELVESSTPLNVPPTSSNEQSPEQAPAGCARSRIPSSIFSTQPGTPTEWSIASNESLFSIHVGNNSLSREQFLSLYKSGELTELDEQIIAQGGAMPSLKELEEMAAAEENAGKGCSRAEETPKTVVGTSEAAEDDDDHNKDGNDDSISGLSDESTFSFAFPVLNSTDGGRMSSVNIRQYNQELNIQSAKQPQEKEPEPEPEQCTEEMKPKAPQKGRNQSWFSCFRCCRYP